MWRRLLVAVFVLAAGTVVAGVGLARGWWRLNHPSVERYPVWGIDVSHHQQRVDWSAVARAPHLAFAYIKATEGGDWRDPRFAENWSGATKAGLKVGAYHFFTFCRPAAEQAANFLAVLPRDLQTLPPAVDLEFGGNCRLQTDRETVRRELMTWLTTVEQALGRRPIIYVTAEAHDAFLSGAALSYPIWLRDVWSEPRPPASPKWHFWQFANRARVNGIETFVDLNVFVGRRGELDSL